MNRKNTAALILCALIPHVLPACTCMDDYLMIDHVIETDLIIKGVVLSTEPMEGELQSKNKHTVEIRSILKGDYKSSKIEILADNFYTSCEVGFAVNKAYILFVKERNGRYHTGFCSKNTPAEHYDGHLKRTVEGYLNENMNMWFDSAGRLRCTGAIIKGKKSGEWKYYSHAGNLLAVESYFMGRRAGEWKYYKTDRSIPNTGARSILYLEEHYFFGEKLFQK